MSESIASDRSPAMPRENPREALVTMPQRLTPDVAKEALIALVRSRDAGNLCNLPLDKLANVPPEKDEEGKFVWWGPIKVDLEGRKYRYARGSGLGGRVCRMHYAGSFELNDGKWVALPPQLMMTSLGAG